MAHYEPHVYYKYMYPVFIAPPCRVRLQIAVLVMYRLKMNISFCFFGSWQILIGFSAVLFRLVMYFLHYTFHSVVNALMYIIAEPSFVSGINSHVYTLYAPQDLPRRYMCRLQGSSSSFIWIDPIKLAYSIPTNLVTGPTATQNLPFFSGLGECYRYYLFRLPMEGWPG